MIVRCNFALKENNNKAMLFFEKAKPYLLTLLYLAIFIALYLIYGSGDTHNNFIYNEF
ncbi:teichoic acid D-Ala incorporation-associated protein DltX [Staphylococcus devriesei]|uniref:Teichoic acid D-Ala incorporation-associated protein DltX n=1 Tax=Staphylococcus devriesei TaxID=586733 RepID=A0A2K4DNY5_9STAP|nr:teichoic acid D-Ala incorporation-associated protein DltX [Staphylococcus devriesei]PTE69145.1 teichoic acid D-Ala incorporation-associated protein DltX [Staphylococcus devriesei]PTF04341.1 teichoic acid D-Ala incorporation-associated protein DltX [Staphylococcus devriesei]PTF13317.1 teichoic acid D-Ala incorporation-associated protein DltX [Staphylococcus devriesei]PTF16623.1 teichoic acid D-Ala incorporation-associated protein DltX [Staphylococcus devriesei]